MNRLSFGKFAATGALFIGTVAFSLTAAPHQPGKSCGEGYQQHRMHQHSAHHAQMHGKHMGMMDRSPMMDEGGHMGMMGHMPMMGGMHKYGGLDLSDEQEQKMHGIQHKLHKTRWGFKGQMIDQHAALREAHAADRPDPTAIGAIYAKIFDLKRQMIEAALEARNSYKDVLTADQLAKMKPRGRRAMQGNMPGCGGIGQGQMMPDQAN